MNKRTKLNINKKRIVFISTLTIFLVIILTIFIITTINTVNKKVRENCFDELTTISEQLSNSLYDAIKNDSTTLTAISTIIANSNLDNTDLCKLLSHYDFDSSYISYLEIFRPDGTMLDADGTVRDVSDVLNFPDEAAKGRRVSNICDSTRDKNVKVLRHAIPIVKDGNTKCILYGTIKLSDLADKYKTDLYDGHAYVYIEDGNTGDFILDTWHKSIGNIIEMGKRKMLPGYSLTKAIDDMKNGKSGQIGFVSKTTGSILYMRYESIGINNWNTMITVEEQYALKNSKSISNSLYLMATIIGLALLIYIVCVGICLLGAYRQVQILGTKDQNTGLLNRVLYDKFVLDSQASLFDSICCVYIDINGLHFINNQYGHSRGDKLLKSVAEILKEKFCYDTLFRIGGDEFVAFSETMDKTECEKKMAEVSKQIEKSGYSISYGVVQYTSEIGLNRVLHDSDTLMLKNKNKYYSKHRTDNERM